MRRSALILLLVLTAVLAPSPVSGDVVVGPGGGTPGTSLNFDLAGHNDLSGFELDGNTTPRGMNAAPALFEDFVYVGNRTDGSSTCGRNDPRRETLGVNACPHPHPGILVVDASDPSDPVVVNEIGPPFAGNVNETTRELRVWPEEELLIVLSFACSAQIHACPGAPPVVPSFRFFDLSNPADPQFLSQYTPRQANGTIRTPHEFFLWIDPNDSDRALLWASTPTSSTNPNNPNLIIYDISDVPEGGQVDIEAQGNWTQFFPGSNNRLHSMTPTVDGTVTHLAYLSAFFLLLDTSDVAEADVPAADVVNLNDDLLTPPENRPTWDNPNPGHSAVPFPGRPFSLVTDEVYGTFTDPSFGCPWGWARMIQVAQPRRPHVVGEYKTAENTCPAPTEADQQFTAYTAHNPTLTRNLALITWHSDGLQAIDISDPAVTAQAGWFSPTPVASVANEDPALSSGDNKVVMWSFPIVKDGLIYVIDVRNGLYILRYTGPRAREVTGLSFLEGNSNLGDAARLDKSARPDADD
jgi:hypothetical protein